MVRWPEWVTVAAVAALAVAAQWVWVGGQLHHPLDYDAAQYVRGGLELRDNLGAGLHPLLNAWFYLTGGAPAVPAMTGVLAKAGVSPVPAAFVSESFWLVVLVAGTYGLARQFMSRTWTLAATAVVAFLPGVVTTARSVNFALPSTAAFTVALALAVSAVREPRWSRWLAVGVALGVTALTRSFMVALVVVVGVVMAGVGVWMYRRRALLPVAVMTAGAAVVAGLWWVKAWRAQLDYLTNYGYQSGSVYYGQHISPASPYFWARRAAQIVEQGTWLPVAVAAAGLLLAGVFVRLRAGRLGVGAVTLGVSLLACYVLLCTSRNNGSGFVLPLVPALVVLAVAAARLLRRVGAVAVAVMAVVVAVTAGVLTVGSGVNVTAGNLPVVSGVNGADAYNATFSRGPRDAWLSANHAIVTATGSLSAPSAWVNTQPGYLNAASLTLASTETGRGLLWYAADATRCRTLSGCIGWLREAPHGALVVLPVAGWDFRPDVPAAMATAAVRARGGAVVRTVRLPDGRRAVVYRW